VVQIYAALTFRWKSLRYIENNRTVECHMFTLEMWAKHNGLCS